MFLKHLQSSLPQTPLGHLSIVALSGGADSVALLLGLLHLGQPLVAAHCNFHLRGEESDADEAFVRQLCEEKGVKLYVEHFDTEAYAKQQRISIEMAARELRYDYFEKLRQQLGATSIAVAHHRDDNVETLLLNLVRGSGLKGLCAMQPQNGFIVRPMLNISRTEIEVFLKEAQQPFRTDSTNTDTAYKRNKIRHELLPLLRELNPSIDRTLAETITRLNEAQSLLQSASSPSSPRPLRSDSIAALALPLRLPLASLQSSPAPQTLIFNFLSPYGFTPSQCRTIAQECSERVGAMYETAEYLCVRDRDALIVAPRPPRITHFELPIDEGELTLPNGATLRLHRCTRTALPEIPKSPNIACLDLAQITIPLFVRTPQEGDRFAPFGMKGTQLISDYLTNRKRNRLEKLASLLLCDAQGPLWLINERSDRRAMITSSTQEVLIVECKVFPSSFDIIPE
ncbi:MAG: tRNA lysidine(34) synthetase TilS [Bacteroidaceae bacterium]|nr:tRNA lysidine(34) synthetase TilS [Bacteroidaceae bacterium]